MNLPKRDRRCIAVVSQLWLGHIPAYHRLLVAACQRQGIDVLSLAPERSSETAGYIPFGHKPGAQEKRAQQTLARPGWRDRCRRWLARTGWLEGRRARRNWRELAAVLRRSADSIDATIITYLPNGFLAPWTSGRWVDRVMTSRWCGIWNGPPIDGGAGRQWGDAVLEASSCAGVWVPDASIAAAWSRMRPRQPIRVFPEIADLRASTKEPDAVRAVKEAARGAKIVGLFGNLHRRKGIFTFAEIARRARAAGNPTFFVAAGDLSLTSSGVDFPALTALAEERQPNFRLMGRRIEDGPEFNAWVASCDVMFCSYEGFPFSSNLLTKAAHFRKPVLVSQGGAMERSVIEFGIGLAVPAGDAVAGWLALQQLLAAALPAPRFADYAAAHSEEQLDPLIRELLNRADSGTSSHA